MTDETHEPVSPSLAPKMKAPPKSRFAIFRLRGLHTRLVLVFVLLAAIMVAVNIGFIVSVNSQMAKKEWPPAASSSSPHGSQHNEVLTALAESRARLLVLLGLTVLGFGSVIGLFVSRVMVPMSSLGDAARKISRGNLNATAPSMPARELVDLGAVINDLSANFQEILLFTGTTVGNTSEAVDRIQEALNGKRPSCEDEVREQVRRIKDDLRKLTAVVKEFEFYQARFNGCKVVADTDQKKDRSS